MMHRALAIVVILVAIACGDSTGPTPASVAGTWNLQAVSGNSLPYTLSQSQVVVTQISGGAIVATRARTFTDTITVKTIANGQTTTAKYADAGTYSLSGTAISFVFKSDGSTGTTVLRGDSVTLVSDGLSLLYTKQ
jgi:Lipocalin-like domain